MADALFAAWKAGNRSNAAEYATPDALNQLFGYGYSPLDRFSGCTQDPIGETICSYSYDQGGYLQFYVDDRAGPLLVTGVRAQIE